MHLLLINYIDKSQKRGHGQLPHRIERILWTLVSDWGHYMRCCMTNKPIDPDSLARKFSWSDKIVLCFPVGQSGMPGMLKSLLHSMLNIEDGKHSRSRSLNDSNLEEDATSKKYIVITAWSHESIEMDDAGKQEILDRELGQLNRLFQSAGIGMEGSFSFLDNGNQVNMDIYQRFLEHILGGKYIEKKLSYSIESTNRLISR